MKRPGVPPIQVPIEELDGLLEQARPALSAEGYQKLHAAIRTLVYVTELLEQKETTLAALRELLCPASTEKTDKVLQQAGVQTGGPGPERDPVFGPRLQGLPVKQENCRRANFTISMTCMGFGANLSGFLSGQKQQKNLSKQELIRRSVRSPLWVC